MSKYIYLNAKEYRCMVVPLLISLWGIGILVHIVTKNFFIVTIAFFPADMMIIMPIFFYNVSISYKLAMNFEVLFCEFNAISFVLLELLLKINELNLEIGLILFYFFFNCIPTIIVACSMFYYDSISNDILSTRFKQILYGVFSITAVYRCYNLIFVPQKGNFTIQIYDDYGLNIQEKCGSAYLALTMFVVKNFVYAIMCPNDFVICTMSLRRKI